MQGVVYITDDTSRHEVTSWRLDDPHAEPPPAVLGGTPGGALTTHVVVVVDASGSMRKEDVPGYGSRTAAVSNRLPTLPCVICPPQPIASLRADACFDCLLTVPLQHTHTYTHGHLCSL